MTAYPAANRTCGRNASVRELEIDETYSEAIRIPLRDAANERLVTGQAAETLRMNLRSCVYRAKAEKLEDGVEKDFAFETTTALCRSAIIVTIVVTRLR